MKCKKVLSYLIAVCLLITSLGTMNIDASDDPDYQSLKTIFGVSSSTSWNIIYNRIMVICSNTGKDKQNDSDDWLDPYVYDIYGTIAYGIPSGKFYARPDGGMRKDGVVGEYQFLGVDANGYYMTNDKYYGSGSPNATFSSVDDYKKIDWKPINKASESWSDYSISDDQRYAMAHNKFYDDDYVGGGEVDLSLKELLGDSLKSKSYVQCAPSLWTVDGSIRLEYGTSNWNTVMIKSLNPNLGVEASIDSENTFTMSSNQNEITIDYDVYGNVIGDYADNSMLKLLDKMTFSSKAAVNPTGTTFKFSSNSDPSTHSSGFSVKYTRGSLKIGSNTKVLSGTVSLTAKDARDKPLSDSASKNITIIMEAPPKKANTGTIDVRCFIKGTTDEIPGTGYTLANVPYNTSKTISIPKEPENYGYKPSIGCYKTSMNLPNADYMDTPAKDFTVQLNETNQNMFFFYWYELKPGVTPDPEKPKDTNGPPIPIISNPYQAYAGDDLKIDGSQSYDVDGSIESYEWSLPGAHEDTQGVNSIGNNSIGYAWYPKVGTYDIGLRVTDDKGASNDGISHINIIPPNPSIEFTVSADKMKENRKVILDVSKSTSSKRFPIDWSLTEWKIEPASETGATGDYGVRFSDGTVYKNVNGIAQKYTNGEWVSTSVPFNTALNGQRTLQFQARDSGKYKISVSITNTSIVDSNSHYANSNKREIEIVEDQPPTADFSAPSSNIRDKESPNGSESQKYGVIPVTCISSSPDGDPMGKRNWGLRYDSDNDGDFSDETTSYRYSCNLLNDPNFLNMPSNWSTWDSIGAPINYSVVESDQKDSKIVKASANHTYQSYFLSGAYIGSNMVGKEYTNSAYIKTEDLTSNVYLGIYWLNSSGAWIWDSNCKYSPTLKGTNDWTKLSVTSTPPVGATAVYLFVINDKGTGNYSVKLPKIEQSGTSTESMANNLLPDPKFSNFTGYWSYSSLIYTLADNELANSKVIQATPNPSSISAFYARGYSDGNIVGKKFTYSVYVKTENITGGIYLATYWMNSAGSWVWENCNTTRVISGTNDWTRLEITSTAPQGAVNPYFMIDINGGTGKYWLRAPQVEQSSKASEFKVSSNPDLFKSGYRLVVSDESSNSAEIYWYDVGSYPLSLTVYEDIVDSETVKELLISSDYKSNHVASW